LRKYEQISANFLSVLALKLTLPVWLVAF